MKIPSRIHRDFEKLKNIASGNPIAALTAVCVALAISWLAHSHGSDESRTIFKHEGPLDFKNASILGNPGQAILHGEERQFSRTQKNVLDAQKELKTEIESLRAEIKTLRTPTPGPSSTPGTEAVYGPTPLPETGKPSTVVRLGEPPEQYGATHLSGVAKGAAVDSISITRAAPMRQSLGMTDLPRSERNKRPGATMISFPVKATGKAYLKEPGIILPSGSYVKAKLLTGVEAPEGKTYPVLMQLDFAYIIPNHKRLDLAGCFIIAKAQGDLSTERVQMQATKLSCVSKSSGMFEREVNGFVADDADNSFAVMGRVNTKQDRVAATAFLSSIVAGIGKAIQQAQTTSQTTPLGGSQSVLTGDQAKYIGAGGASESATLVTQWYLKQAQNLLPTINVGSGQEVWVIMQDQVDLPKDYFTQNSSGGIVNASIYSHFTRIIE